MYIKNDLNCTEIPYRFNVNKEFPITLLSHVVLNIHAVGIYLGWDLELRWLGVLAGGAS